MLYPPPLARLHYQQVPNLSGLQQQRFISCPCYMFFVVWLDVFILERRRRIRPYLGLAGLAGREGKAEPKLTMALRASTQKFVTYNPAPLVERMGRLSSGWGVGPSHGERQQALGNKNRASCTQGLRTLPGTREDVRKS